MKKIQKPYGRQRWRALGCGGPRPCPHREPRGAGPGYCRLSAAARAHSSRPSWSALRITDPSILREGDLCRPGGTGRTAGRTAAPPLLAFSGRCPLFSSPLPCLPFSPPSPWPCFSTSINGSLSALPLDLSHPLSALSIFPCPLSPVSGCHLASSLNTHVPDSGPGAPSPARDQMRVSHINFSEKGSPSAWRRDPTLVTAATRQPKENKSPERNPRSVQESESGLSPPSPAQPPEAN